MKLNKSEVEHVASLARLELSEEEIDSYSKDLSSILNYVQTLNELDTSDVEETERLGGLVDVFRDDIVLDWDRTEVELALKQGEREDGSLKVKRVL